MSHDEAAPESQGVTVKTLATVDLGPEIEGTQGRQLRMRILTCALRSVSSPVHDDQGRPGPAGFLEALGGATPSVPLPITS